jgi:hypothetical protein
MQWWSVGFHGKFITVVLSSIYVNKPYRKLFSREFCFQLMEHGPTSRAGFALDITLSVMNEPVRHTSTDGKLTLLVHVGADGETAVGFEGGDWHTHPDLLAAMLGVPEEAAVTEFISRLQADDIPIVVSTDCGVTVAPWVSDNLEATLSMFGSECVLRYWSGAEVVANDR